MILAISGKAGIGKDHLTAEIMAADHYRKWKVKKFSFKVKQVCSQISGLSYDTFEYHKDRMTIYGITCRQLMQVVAEKLRELDPNIWIKALFVDYDPKEYWIINDLRYQNEFDYLQDQEAMLIRMNGIRDIAPMSHLSEVDLDQHAGWHHCFYNGVDHSANLALEARLILRKVRSQNAY